MGPMPVRKGCVMRVSNYFECKGFPCSDAKHDCCIIPDINLKPGNISMVMISEAAPVEAANYYYSKGETLFGQTTVQAFNDAGVNVSSVRDLVEMGVYFTTAVKCGKTGYGIKTATIKECSSILAKELSIFSNVKVLMLMGDVAIKALNYIAKRAGQDKVIPAGSTYKIRGKKYFFGAIRVFPSYLQAGPAFFIEKSKRRMIAEDIQTAWRLINNAG